MTRGDDLGCDLRECISANCSESVGKLSEATPVWLRSAVIFGASFNRF
jgi:hypothetical protein